LHVPIIQAPIEALANIPGVFTRTPTHVIAISRSYSATHAATFRSRH
jgi:hypothetical protein